MSETKAKIGVIANMKPVGQGLRVCVDFVDALGPEEGLWVGGTGHGYLLIVSENRTSETYPARPFRVNAGALHQYVWLASGKTAYLSDIRSGMRLTVATVEGQTRSVAVGRVKCERRDLLRLAVSVDSKELSAYLQDADSVYCATPDGIACVRGLHEGDQIVCQTDDPGRHLGERVDEYIRED